MLSNILKKLITPAGHKWLYNAAGFNQYGLMRDDLRTELDPRVEEALKRLPDHIMDERNFRIVRAMQLDAMKRILPPEQWTKYEDDVLYLTPLVDEVIKEREEKEKWDLE
ncbi:PREDICTED: cytochrome b-c1 complex subunit 7 [Polistes canadensis]|uniref:cytochrome b-c1 complex subunit 7 n=1 Tax=Polistes canadensis TaxID=91411 RepID=UPI000718D534|nr:PREDICTED: cytochrome b-c1 complex subunit 7 [Polistes canadensis]